MNDEKYKVRYFEAFYALFEQCSKLSLVEAIIYCHLWNDGNYYGKDYAPTNKRLARVAKCSVRTASAALDKLEKLGLIKRVMRIGATSLISVNDWRSIPNLLDADTIEEKREREREEYATEKKRLTAWNEAQSIKDEPEPLQEPVITPDEPTHSLPIETPQNEAQDAIEPVSIPHNRAIHI